MKRFLILLPILTVCIVTCYAQDRCDSRRWRFGVVGGANYTQLESYGEGLYTQFDKQTMWHAGVSAQYKWGRFVNFSVQPELRYKVSVTDADPVIGPTYGSTKIGMVELPVNFQVGLQLSPIFRPFIQGSGHISYITNSSGIISNVIPLNKFNAGLGAGVGFDLWKFQFQCNYRWNLTKLNKDKELFERLTLQGFEFTVGFMF